MKFNHFLMFLIFLSHQAFALDIYSQVSGSITNIKNIGDSDIHIILVEHKNIEPTSN